MNKPLPIGSCPPFSVPPNQTALKLETDPSDILNELIECCRKGGRIAVAGAYAGVSRRCFVLNSVARHLQYNRALNVTHQ